MFVSTEISPKVYGTVAFKRIKKYRAAPQKGKPDTIQTNDKPILKCLT